MLKCFYHTNDNNNITMNLQGMETWIIGYLSLS